MSTALGYDRHPAYTALNKYGVIITGSTENKRERILRDLADEPVYSLNCQPIPCFEEVIQTILEETSVRPSDTSPGTEPDSIQNLEQAVLPDTTLLLLNIHTMHPTDQIRIIRTVARLAKQSAWCGGIGYTAPDTNTIPLSDVNAPIRPEEYRV